MKDFLERVRYKTIVLEEDERGRAAGQVFVKSLYCCCWSVGSVPNSSDGLIFVKRRALDGPFLDKNTGFRRALFGQKYGL